MASKKNKWRGPKDGLQFRRETKRYSDGTPWGHDVLYVRVKGKWCAVVEPLLGGVAVLTDTYHRTNAVEAAKLIRQRYIQPHM